MDLPAVPINNRAHKPVPDSAQALAVPLEGLTPPLDWAALFGRPAPVAIEIGTGNGYFIEREAARLPEMNFLGVEYMPLFYWKMTKRCARAGLTNVRTTSADAFELLREWIPERSVRRVYCYFSDPWPKRRHRDRRIFGPHLPPLLERILEPGGEVWFKTDMGYYFNLGVTAFREHGRWEFEQIGPEEKPDPARGEVVTNFERKAREAGGGVWGFRARMV